MPVRYKQQSPIGYSVLLSTHLLTPAPATSLPLQELDLVGCGLRDLTPLSNCISLRKLSLRGCEAVEDLDPLQRCTRLQVR